VNPKGSIKRVVYMGTPEIAVPPLLGILEAGYEIPLVVSGQDKRRGRGSRLAPSPVKREAERLGINVTSDVNDVKAVTADIGVVVAFGKLVPSDVLNHLKMVNIHFSLLPRWRGAAPLERAILAGDQTTGVSIMELEETLDTGGVYHSVEIPIDTDETLKDLQEKCVITGTNALLKCLGEGFGEPIAQKGEATYAQKITSSDLEIKWHLPADEISRVVRIGRAWTTTAKNRLRIHSIRIGHPEVLNAGERSGVLVGTGDVSIELVKVQPEGRKIMSAQDWVNGLQGKSNGRLGHG
tara:strand:- start:139 stop:1023 length:885 start_codon:yes stop_codon:yes gene_type:complete